MATNACEYDLSTGGGVQILIRDWLLILHNSCQSSIGPKAGCYVFVCMFACVSGCDKNTSGIKTSKTQELLNLIHKRILHCHVLFFTTCG